MSNVKYIVGKEKEFLVKPSLPFGNLEIDFLNKLSIELMSNKKAKSLKVGGEVLCHVW